MAVADGATLMHARSGQNENATNCRKPRLKRRKALFWRDKSISVHNDMESERCLRSAQKIVLQPNFSCNVVTGPRKPVPAAVNPSFDTVLKVMHALGLQLRAGLASVPHSDVASA